ncbi:MAG TPA: tRNA pseudouridine(13) synthase TruD [Gammaproteobacteria bacterium]
MNFEKIEWAYAAGTPLVSGVMRALPEDFAVDEVLGFEPDGEGEHVLIHIRKRNTNTEWLAKQLARFAGVKPMDVSYAGLKDRHAVTTQWFSIGLAGKPQPDWKAIENDDIQVLQVARHRRKLRRGALKGNRFRLHITQLLGELSGLEERLQRVAKEGVPNYFGEQRFGFDHDNLRRADAMFRGELHERDRHKRGLYLSAARSYLFNEVLSRRVGDGTWSLPLPGEALMLAGSHSFFVADEIDATILARIEEGDIHPSGPLWGRGELATHNDARELEQEVLARYNDWCASLEKAGLEQERRALRLLVQDLSWIIDAEQRVLTLSFMLDAGSYATTVLRELVAVQETGGAVTSAE